MFVYIKEIKEAIKVDEIKSIKIDNDGDIRIETNDDIYHVMSRHCDMNIENRLIELVDKINNCYSIKLMG